VVGDGSGVEVGVGDGCAVGEEVGVGVFEGVGVGVAEGVGVADGVGVGEGVGVPPPPCKSISQESPTACCCAGQPHVLAFATIAP